MPFCGNERHQATHMLQRETNTAVKGMDLLLGGPYTIYSQMCAFSSRQHRLGTCITGSSLECSVWGLWPSMRDGLWLWQGKCLQSASDCPPHIPCLIPQSCRPVATVGWKALKVKVEYSRPALEAVADASACQVCCSCKQCYIFGSCSSSEAEIQYKHSSPTYMHEVK